MTKSKKRWLWGAVIVVVAGGAVVAMRSRDKKDPKAAASPFRLGKVQEEPLQVSVREVGVVDPVTKVDVKSAVSGRVLSLRVREGAVVKSGDVLAEVEPDVNQAQSLSEVSGGLTQAQLKLQDAEREFASQKALFDQGLLGSDAFKGVQNKREQAVEALKSARMLYQIVEDRGIPISGNAASQKARVVAPMSGVVIKKGVELGETVTSGVSSFNAGTVLFTVADSAELVEKIKVFKVEISLNELSEAYRTGMSANVEILGEKRDKAVSIPLEALQRKDGETVAYRLKKDLKPKQVAAAKSGLSGRTKFIWLSDHWKEYFDVVPVKAGVATLERVEILAGLAPGQEVALEDPTKKKVEKDDDN